jgi:hypothetical protein
MRSSSLYLSSLTRSTVARQIGWFYGRAIAHAVSRRLPTTAARVRGQVMSCGICGGQSDTGAGFPPEYFGFPCQFSFHRLLHTHHLSSGAVADVRSGVGLIPPLKKKKKKLAWFTRSLESVVYDLRFRGCFPVS